MKYTPPYTFENIIVYLNVKSKKTPQYRVIV